MFPILVKIPIPGLGALTITTYGVLVATAFVLGILLAARRAKNEGLDPNAIYDLAVWIIIAAIGGSRLLHVITQWDHYAARPLDIFKIWEGGLAFYGGFVLGIPAVIWFLKRRGLPVLKVGDILAPSVALGLAIGRLGCFSAGCDFGTQTDLPWAVTFTHPESLAKLGVPLHPTQLYESFGSLAIFGILLAYHPRKRFDGETFYLYMVLYGIFRFLIEFIRGDVDRGFILAGLLSTSQAIAIPFVLASVILIVRGRRSAGGA